jgi:hypothetical protein
MYHYLRNSFAKPTMEFLRSKQVVDVVNNQGDYLLALEVS